MSYVRKTFQSAGIGVSNLLNLINRRNAGNPNVLEVTLSGRVEEVRVTGLWHRFMNAPVLHMHSLLAAIKQAAIHPSIRVLLLKVENNDLGWGRVEEVCEAIARFRAAGKYAVCYLEEPENIDTMLAASCDKVIVPPGMPLYLTGLASEVMYFKQLLDKLDVKPELFQAGKYKSAVEPYTRQGMSKASREAIEGLLDDIFAHWVSRVAQGRGLAPDRVRALIDQGPWMSESAREAGLVDENLYEDQIDEFLEKWLGIPPLRISLDKFSRFYSPKSDISEPWKKKKGLAIITATGAIHGGESRYLGPGDATTGADTLREALAEVREDDTIAAVVLRIDSPGGSAVHSDLIWREVERLKKAKPVIVSMADVAASGGYYIAMPADKILASATTLTGSIGVIGGKINLKGLYSKLGINKESVARGKHANMETDYGPYPPELKKKIKTEMETIYKVFVEKAAQGRKTEFSAIDNAAQGRVWTGDQARVRNLVDEIGGLLAAIDRAKESAGIPVTRYVPVTILPRIKKMSLPMLPFALPAQSELSSLAAKMKLYAMLADMPVLAHMPYILKIR